MFFATEWQRSSDSHQVDHPNIPGEMRVVYGKLDFGVKLGGSWLSCIILFLVFLHCFILMLKQFFMHTAVICCALSMLSFVADGAIVGITFGMVSFMVTVIGLVIGCVRKERKRYWLYTAVFNFVLKAYLFK